MSETDSEYNINGEIELEKNLRRRTKIYNQEIKNLVDENFFNC